MSKQLVVLHYFLIYIVAVSIVLFHTSCRNQIEKMGNTTVASNQRKPLQKKAGLQRIYVDEIPGIINASRDEFISIQVTGNLPDPSYELDYFHVEVKDVIIEITPFAQKEAMMIVSQVLVPFSEKVDVGRLPSGEYLLRIIGRSYTQESKLRVE